MILRSQFKQFVILSQRRNVIVDRDLRGCAFSVLGELIIARDIGAVVVEFDSESQGLV